MGRGLATIDAMTLPGAVVRPSTCEVETSGGIELLEPRMMQVLVELVEARGRVVSRDALIERCWDGLVVSDDAINRVTARLRRLGTDTGAFTLETIRKVGYRLLVAGEVPDADVARHPRTPRRRAAMARAVATAGLALVAVAGFRVGNRPAEARAEPRDWQASAPLSLQRLPGRWGPAGCRPTLDFVVRAGRIVVSAPGYRSERRIIAADDVSVMAEGVLPVGERGRLFELRPDGDRLSVQDRTTNLGEVFDVCPLARR
ncbi:MAG: winged helix-turn-helix domain-containing protein [Pseudomonadota bacterium]